MFMKLKHSLLAATLGLILGGSALAASMSAGEAQYLLERDGFTDVSDLRYSNGVWIGTALNSEGDTVDVTVKSDRRVTWSGPTRSRTTVTTTTTRREPYEVARVEAPIVVEEVPVARRPIMVEKRVIVPVGGRLSKNDVRTVLAANGYHDIHDIDWKSHRHVWKAEARDPSGDDLEIYVDPIDGRILDVDDD
jgi:hypothetical protein